MTSADTMPIPPPPGEWDRWKDWADAIPAVSSMALECTEVSQGHAAMRMAASPWPPNPNGAVHGGLVAAAADHVGGLAAVTQVSLTGLPATAALSGQYIRPAFAPLTFDARVVNAGRTVVFVHIEVTNHDGQLCSFFTGSWSTSGSGRIDAGARVEP
ncbi:PaaI family thioesterase [Nocardia fluminea]|uniref:PaaI family thioesterase n=1 Tax=Nocardia fluminea TaxID=134984 RepID=UPI00366C8EFB